MYNMCIYIDIYIYIYIIPKIQLGSLLNLLYSSNIPNVYYNDPAMWYPPSYNLVYKPYMSRYINHKP